IIRAPGTPATCPLQRLTRIMMYLSLMRTKMDQALKRIGDIWARYRVIAALVGLIMIGALFAWTAAAWYFQNRLDAQALAFNTHIKRLEMDMDYERNMTQERLGNVAVRVDDIVKRLAALTPQVEQASETAGKAARQAGSAAEQAAKASIRIRE